MAISIRLLKNDYRPCNNFSIINGNNVIATYGVAAGVNILGKILIRFLTELVNDCSC